MDGQQPAYTLVWSGSTPGNLIIHCDVHVNFGRRIPLVFRAAAGAVEPRVFNTHPTPDICYLSEIEFVTRGIAEVPLGPGDHTLDIILLFGDREVLKPKRYLLTVPAAECRCGSTCAKSALRG